MKEFAMEKFILLCGPRQVGKTTLAKYWLSEQTHGLYLNWDNVQDRSVLLEMSFLHQQPFPEALVLDEVHKYIRWKSWLKGLYDKEAQRLQAIVTGSARLDIYQKGGDSLLGRYELLHLHPLSIGELTHGQLIPPPSDWLKLEPRTPDTSLWPQLAQRSGFPEPFYKDNALQHRRWSNRRRELLIQQDLRELSQIKMLSMVSHLALLLPRHVGSTLSVNSLREELQVSFDSIQLWLKSLEHLYYCFRIAPYSKKIAKSLRKEHKLYLWDWSVINDPGARFENMVASHLLKAIHSWNDVGYGQFELMYWRDTTKREVDFVILNDHQPIALIECKRSQQVLSPALLYLGEHLNKIPQIQLIEEPGIDKIRGQTRVVSAD